MLQQQLSGHPPGEADAQGSTRLATHAPPALAEYRDSETAFNQFFWASPTPMAISDLEGRVQRVNPAWEPLLKCSCQEMEGTLLSDWVHPEDSVAAAAEFERLSISGHRTDIECRCQGKDGSYRWLLLNACAVKDARVIYLTAHDITRWKEAEETRRNGEAQFRELFDDAPVAYHELDLNGVVCRVNRAECALLGYEANEILGRPIWEFIAGAEQETSRAVYRQKLFGERLLAPHQRLYRHCGGGEVCVEIHDALVRNATGETTGMRTALLDITERNRAEEALRESEETNRLLFEYAPSAVVVHDIVLDMAGRPVDFVFTSANPAFEKQTGLHVEDVIGRRLTEVLPGIDKTPLFEIYGKVALTGEAVSFEHYSEVVGRHFSVSAYRIGTGCLATRLTDITERKRMMEALEVHAEKLARSNIELERFAYVASHDLQEPLRMVASFTQLLSKRYSGKLDETADRYIDFAVDGAKRMQQLIADLLTYSRVTNKEIEPRQADSRALVVTAAENLQVAIEESGASVDWDPLPEVWVDQTQFIQLLQNLLANAIKFRQKDAAPRIHVSAEDTGGEWRFSVQDNGIGIDPRHADRIFQVFQRLHTRADYPGTGIGLAVCQKVVERHGGKIWVESEPGAGSTFRFTIPKHGRSE